MRITQGTFSFLPDMTDEQIEAQVRYALGKGWAMSLEHTGDPHPRNSYWEMWGPPMFDLDPDQPDIVMRELRACREAFPARYVKLLAYDSSRYRQTTAFAIIVNRPAQEPGFRLERQERQDRQIAYTLHPHAQDGPGARRYGAGAAGAGDNGRPGT